MKELLDRLTVKPTPVRDKNTDNRPLLCRVTTSVYREIGFRLQYSQNTGDHILNNIEPDLPAALAGIQDGQLLLQVNLTRTTGLLSMFPVFIPSFQAYLTFVKNQAQRKSAHCSATVSPSTSQSMCLWPMPRLSTCLPRGQLQSTMLRRPRMRPRCTNKVGRLSSKTRI